MNFLQLRYFVEVAHTNHMTQAANNLFISQPALSKSIKLLENELGTPVFDREGGKIRLNSNGEIFYKYCCQALSAIDQAKDEIADNNNAHPQVTVSVNAGTQFLPDIITNFRKQFGNIKLNINQEPLSLRESHGNSDLYIYSSLVPVSASNSITLLSEDCYIGIPSEDSLANNKIIHPSMLQGKTFLTVKENLPLNQLTHFLCERGGFTLDTKLEFENRETILTLIEEGFGISIIPQKTWAPHVNLQKITLRPLSVDCNRYIILTWNEKKYISKSVQTMINFLKKYFEDI